MSEKIRDITKDERMLLSSMKRCPGLYLGTTTLKNFITWIFGYEEALRITGLYSEREILPDGIVDYVALKYTGSTEIPSSGWTSIILEKEPDEKKAFFVFFELLDEYLISLGYEPISLFEDIEDELKKQRIYKKS